MKRSGRRQDLEKERQWRRVIQEATGSGLSIRAYCRQHGIKASRFYWWQRRLKKNGQRSAATPKRHAAAGRVSFALVSDEPGDAQTSGIELVLADGRRLRIGRGVDEATLHTVLVVLEAKRC